MEADDLLEDRRRHLARMARMWREGMSTLDIARALHLEEHEVYREIERIKGMAKMIGREG